MTACARHQKNYFPSQVSSQTGFTLIELLMALVVAALAMSAILMANMGQHRTYNTQLQIADARQKARSVIAMLRTDLLAAQGFRIAQPTNVTVYWQNNDGNLAAPATFTAVTYSWQAGDSDGNGVGLELLRGEGQGASAAAAATAANGSRTVFADGIDGLELYYQPSGSVASTTPANLNSIIGVTISLVARAGGADPSFRDADTYPTASSGTWPTPPSGTGPPSNFLMSNADTTPVKDNFHRRLWKETVACRNLVQ